MTKYIDADRLRAEINKSINTIVTDALDPDAGIERVASAKYRKDALKDVLSIIGSLQQEQPEVDLEKELDKWRHDHFHGERDGRFSGEYLERASQLDLARHFAQWKKEKMLEEAVEAIISQCPGSNEIIFHNPISVHCWEFPWKFSAKGLNKGDKVKLIIIKED